MLSDDLLLVNLSLQCLSLKELVSQEEAGGTGLGCLAKELGWEVASRRNRQEGMPGWKGP